MADNRLTILIPAPPFYSHFRPLLSLAESLRARNNRVIIACDEAFREESEALNLEFETLSINKNINTGSAGQSGMAGDEQKRLEEFLDATRIGAVEALCVQAVHRRRDMLPDPESLVSSIETLRSKYLPDLWIVDYLSYGVTLALVGMEQSFYTFCAPHPSAIPEPESYYGIPGKWPIRLRPDRKELDRLIIQARQTDESFTEEFNRVLVSRFDIDPVSSAFRLVGPRGVIHNYPPLRRSHRTRSRHFYAGHSFRDVPLPEEWADWVETPTRHCIVSFGTFLSDRSDVVEPLIEMLQRLLPELYIAAGIGSRKVVNRNDPGIRTEPFIPLKALLPHVDFIIHHGGVSTFTETLYCGCPSIIMPFSSDQFDVAADAERKGLAEVLDPNNLNMPDLEFSLKKILQPKVQRRLHRIRRVVRRRGPDWMARQIMRRER